LVTPGETVVPEHKEVTCYAESRDGRTWSKPSLGIVKFQGSKDNNIIWDGFGTHNFMVFLDTNPATPAEQRYKALATEVVLLACRSLVLGRISQISHVARGHCRLKYHCTTALLLTPQQEL